MSSTRRLWDPRFCVGAWPLNNHAQDVSGYGNHGTWTGNTVYAAGPYGRQVGSFDGTNSAVVVPSNARYNFASEFTLAILAKPTDTDADRRVLYRYDPTSGTGYYVGQYNAGAGLWRFIVFTGGGTNSVYSDSPPSGQWQHIACVRDSAGTLSMYVDGIAQSTPAAQAGAITSTGSLYIGIDYQSSSDFIGLAANARLYNIALTQDEILSLYRARR